MNSHFTEEDVQVASKHIKICSTSSAVREIQMKRTVRYHYTCIRMAKKKKKRKKTPDTTSAGKDVEKEAHPYVVGRAVKLGC